GGPPMSSGWYFPDAASGSMAAGLLMAALRRVRETGTGVVIDLAQSDVATWLLGDRLLGAQMDSTIARERFANRHERFAPQACLPCKGDDAWLVLTVQ